jgi:hypothetical protein
MFRVGKRLAAKGVEGLEGVAKCDHARDRTALDVPNGDRIFTQQKQAPAFEGFGPRLAQLQRVGGPQSHVPAFAVVPVAKHPAFRARLVDMQVKPAAIGQHAFGSRLADVNGRKSIDLPRHGPPSFPSFIPSFVIVQNDVIDDIGVVIIILMAKSIRPGISSCTVN